MNLGLKYTYDDYRSIGHDEKRFELIAGDLLLTPSPNVRHQRVALNIATMLRAFAEGRGLGLVLIAPLDVVLSRHDVVQPDVLYVAQNRLSIVTEESIQGPPDLVVEVLSPSTSSRDRQLKRVTYARFGVKEYWIADPDARSIEVLRASDTGFETVAVVAEGGSVKTPLLEGFALDVSSVFAAHV